MATTCLYDIGQPPTYCWQSLKEKMISGTEKILLMSNHRQWNSPTVGVIWKPDLNWTDSNGGGVSEVRRRHIPLEITNNLMDIINSKLTI
jgi:hypothetical protein